MSEAANAFISRWSKASPSERASPPSRMTWAEFKRKWSRYSGRESSAYQEHFNDLCHLLGQPTPAHADPTDDQFFCFQKRVVKDLELLPADSPTDEEPGKRGFADVWKKDCFR